jgi:PilZ domain
MSPARVSDRYSVYSERRSRCRYPLNSELQCKLICSGKVYSGHGVDLSSHGMCFVCSDILPIAAKVEISFVWPVHLSGVTPLQLRVVGHVLRHDKRGTAIKMLRYQFHTRKNRDTEAATVLEK